MLGMAAQAKLVDVASEARTQLGLGAELTVREVLQAAITQLASPEHGRGSISRENRSLPILEMASLEAEVGEDERARRVRLSQMQRMQLQMHGRR